MKYFGNAEQTAAQTERLSEDACHVGESLGRAFDTDYDGLRNDFQRDRDRIIHTKAFRRLSHKTQVFLAPEGDHFRTRLTHTLEVSQIARTISRALSLNEDLTEAIALGHDLGHTPFGHCGEAALTACLADAWAKGLTGGATAPAFFHNEQSLRVVDVIENGGKGLNLTAEVRDGIVHHTGDVRPATLEGRVVAIADRIAYVNHDIDDAIRAGVLTEADLPETTHAILGRTHSTRIDTLVVDLVQTSIREGDIRMTPRVWDAMMELRAFLTANVYQCPRVMAEVAKADHMIRELFAYFMDHPELVSAEYRALSPGDDVRAVTDFIACMTDRYATQMYKRLFIPSALDEAFD